MGKEKKEPFSRLLNTKKVGQIYGNIIFDLKPLQPRGSTSKTPWSNVNLIRNKTLGKEH
jgi:hypothetical protein